MTIQQFNILDDVVKEELISDYGTYLATYDEGNIICDAYELFDFYVGLCFEVGKNERATITAHTNPDELPYLVKIEKLT